MAAKNSYHVIADPRGGWSVVRDGAERASKRFSSQADAVQWGRQISRNKGSEFFVHRNDGTIERKDSYGNDPLPPRDHR
jgi:hypothetical protein